MYLRSVTRPNETFLDPTMPYLILLNLTLAFFNFSVDFF